MMIKNVDKHYVSDIDRYLNELRRKPRSASQQAEHEEYQRLIELRDKP